MVYACSINGLSLQAGDLICTTDGGAPLVSGQFWRLIGKLIPGDVDHIAIYVGPDGRCVEAGARGRVITFDMPEDTWDAERMFARRRLIDTFYGIAYPLEGRGLSNEEVAEIRDGVADYCLKQAQAGKPYNVNFLDSDTEASFYCSQLAYKAYLRHGIDLNTGIGVPHIPGTGSIVFPQEIWKGCSHRSV